MTQDPMAPLSRGSGPDALARRDFFIAVLVGALAAVAIHASVWAAPATRFAGDWRDADVLTYQQAWRWAGSPGAWHGGILNDLSAYAPTGLSPLARIGGLSALFAGPFSLLLGWPLGVNVWTALVTGLNVAAGGLLARVLGADRAWALFAGVCFGASPYFLTEFAGGRLAQLPAWELAAGIALWIRLLERPTPRGALAAGALLGLAVDEYAWYGVFGAGTAALLTLARVRGPRPPELAACVRRAALTGLVVALPGIALALLGASPGAGTAMQGERLATAWSLPWSWILVDGTVSSVSGRVSWSLLAAAVAASLLARDWRARGLGLTALAATVLAMGPRLLSGAGEAEGSHFPFYVVYMLFPGEGRFPLPHQHLVLISLIVPAAAASVFTAASARLPGSLRGPLVLGAALLVGAELRWRGAELAVGATIVRPTPDWVADLAELDPGAVLALPLAPSLRASQAGLALQMADGRPHVDGPTMWLDPARPAAWDAWRGSSGFLTELRRFEGGEEVRGDPTRANFFRYPPEDVARLVGEGVRWVVVSDDMYVEPLRGLATATRELFEQLTGPPVLRAEGVAVYDLGGHRGDGELTAPIWRLPASARPGNGTRPMSGRIPNTPFFQRP